MAAVISVLWWGRTLLTLGPDGEPIRKELAAGGEPLAEVCDFLNGLEPMPQCVRLIYHAPELAPVATTCPKGSRKTVQQALAARFPALSEPLTAWAAHRIRSSTSGTTTLLYVEEQPALSRLKADLDDRGIALTGVFPILTVLEAAPLLATLYKPVIALVHTDDAAAVFWRTGVGDRHASFFDGATAKERALRELVTGFSVFKDAPAFALINLGTAVFDLRTVAQRAAMTAGPKEFLEPAAALDGEALCNFFPPPPFFTPDRICQIAAVILFAAGLAVTTGQVGSRRTTGASQALQAAEIVQLIQRVEHLKANQTSVEIGKILAEEVLVAPPIKRAFLVDLGRERPTEMSFTSVSLNEHTWSVSGTAHAGIGVEKGPYETFLSRFGAHPGWTLAEASRLKIVKAPNFTLNGSFP